MRIKGKAKHQGYDFNLSVEDIHIPLFCPILGIELDPTAKKPAPNCLSVDRIDNSKGYVKGNVCIVSYLGNLQKRDNTIESLKRILNYMEERLG